jgi:molybdopterin/thiamine biosynthesis adenylyltransferase
VWQPYKWTPPRIFDLKESADRVRLQEEFDSGSIDRVFDGIMNIANDLFDIYHPGERSNAQRRAAFVQKLIDKKREYGKWVLFPWLNKLVHYPEPDDHFALRTSRNRNLITADEQQKLRQATVTVFGLSVGRAVVKMLTLSGIGGTLILGDYDTLEPSNMNRIDGVFSDVGCRKLDQIACAISEMDPFITQIHLHDGFTPENAAIVESHTPDILVDEVDYWPAKVGIRALAAKLNIPVLMAADLDDISQLDVEYPGTESNLPFNGQMTQVDLENISPSPQENLELLLKLIGKENISSRVDNSLNQVIRGELAGLPQLGTTAALGGVLVAVAARESILGRPIHPGRYTVSTKVNRVE